jgi:hypothetical protein
MGLPCPIYTPHLCNKAHYVSTSEIRGAKTMGSHSYSEVLANTSGAQCMPPAEEAAVRLRDAYRGIPVAPLRDLLGPVDADSAYAVQHINTRFWEAR